MPLFFRDHGLIDVSEFSTRSHGLFWQYWQERESGSKGSGTRFNSLGTNQVSCSLRPPFHSRGVPIYRMTSFFSLVFWQYWP